MEYLLDRQPTPDERRTINNSGMVYRIDGKRHIVSIDDGKLDADQIAFLHELNFGIEPLLESLPAGARHA